MNKNLSTLSELTHENKQNIQVDSLKIMTGKIVLLQKKHDRPYDLLDENEKIAILKDGKLLLMKLNHF
jgi:hypothetical protein